MTELSDQKTELFTDSNIEDSEVADKILEVETEKLTIVPPKNHTLKIALLAILTALGPALSISFIWFPYFELMTLTIFLSGIILGPLYGSILAILSTSLYEIIVSLILGPALPVYPFKVIAFCIVALFGALLGYKTNFSTSFFWRLFFGVLGGLLTLSYDLIVSFGMFLFLGTGVGSYFAFILVGLPVTAIRVATNTLLFAFIPDIILRTIKPLIIRFDLRKQHRKEKTSLEM
ncbi:MAG: hypothetical protein ACTSO7_00910 [Candidatus Heimdallarchaeota archaeon]